MSKIYFEKIQNTSDQSITKFYYNKYDQFYNDLDFLKSKIKSLIKSEKTSESVKKQLTRLVNFDFEKYDLFYIYSNILCFGINTQEKKIDFYKNDFDSIINLQGFTKNYNCKIGSSDQDQVIDSSDLPVCEEDQESDQDQE